MHTAGAERPNIEVPKASPILTIVNSGELGSRNDGATPISNRRATSDDVTNFPSIDYSIYLSEP
ncbi:palindromic element RPE2 domain-containing protein [Candidatus Tisiphia endosymbiont of Mystacides longicornis]|uniref:palindromic element RPE2 domain-containing protein n=1 Tax=Candidatus Tisiphia endosymbiont of Mystacides longicornis TaxID=3139330 RepID=UPI003CCB1427